MTAGSNGGVSGFPQYAAYRSSGIEWLGDVPEHWEVHPLKSVLTRNDSGVWGDDADEHEGTIVLRSTDQTIDGGWTIDDPARRTLSAHEKADALLMAGDLVVTKSSGSKFHIGKTSLVTDHMAQLGACFSNFMQRLRCLSSFEPRLAWYLLNSPVGRQQLVFNSNTTTGLANLNGTILGGVATPLPPIDEQRAIGAFLDRETGRIDTLVEKKRLLIERLQEYRAALITRTVTRGLPPEAARAAGLDPSPRLKPSGTEWLGDVPEHWEWKRLEHVGWYRTSSVDKKAEEGELPVRLCNYTDVYYRDRIRASDGEYMEATASLREITRFKLCVGDVLITKDSEDWRDIAVPALVDETADDFVCGYHLGIIRPGPMTDPGFMFRTMQSVAVNQQLQTSASGVTRYGLPNAAVGRVTIPLPPLDEQRAIGAFLDHETARLDELSSQVETAIERLQEHRMALITAAVTGKIDVRESVSEHVAPA